MKIALAQLNSKVGDIAKNEALHTDAIARAVREGAELLVFPEMSILGYPPRDLVARHGVVEASLAAVERLAALVPASMLVLVGLPIASRGRPFQNALALLRAGRIECFEAPMNIWQDMRHYQVIETMVKMTMKDDIARTKTQMSLT